MIDRLPTRIDVRTARGLQRIEPIALALSARLVVRTLSWKRALALFDRLPTTSRQPPTKSTLPQESDFRGAGACLARSLARSQYLRRRGIPSVIVIGAFTSNDGPASSIQLDAHAWIEPFDDSPSHAVLHRIPR